MADWTILQPTQGVRKRPISLDVVVPFILGLLLARGGVLEVFPFGVAYGAALWFKGGRGLSPGLLGVLVGTFTLQDYYWLTEVGVLLAALGIILPRVRHNSRERLYLGFLTFMFVMIIAVVAWSLRQPGPLDFPLMLVQGVLTGGLAIIFWFALIHQDAVWRGEFVREQGIAWLMLLIGVLSGLDGIFVAELSLSVVVLSFFVLLVSERYGAGSAAGVGVLLGFLPQLEIDAQNLMDAGIYGLAGFCTGAFRRFGKLGIGAAFAGVMLALTVFLRQDAVFSQLLSSGVGLLLFLIWPSAVPEKEYSKPKPMPEVETTVAKVRTLANIFDELALSYQAAGMEHSEERTEISELMNVLVERVCRTCPTVDVCWEREFYKTYHFLFEFFVLVEKNRDTDISELPLDWKRQCGRLKEILLGIQFIMEHERSQQAWRRRLAQNREALSSQFQSVSNVIGHLAKELHVRHNWWDGNPANLARRRRHFLDVGVAAYSKCGTGISGDNYASLAFSPTQHAFILCDGMGVGEKAAKMSAAALALLEQLLTTGFEPEGAVQALNSILVLRSPEEGFVTIDMAVLDLESDAVKLIKVGASPAYIRKGDGVAAFASSSLPAGILNQIEIPVIETELAAGEVLVLVTDGIHDVLMNGTDWVPDFLRQAEATQAQLLAEEIAQEARRLSAEEMQDDGVVMVIRKNYWNE